MHWISRALHLAARYRGPRGLQAQGSSVGGLLLRGRFQVPEVPLEVDQSHPDWARPEGVIQWIGGDG
eukprot:8338367-Pyramimonas_sp.AAC.1